MNAFSFGDVGLVGTLAVPSEAEPVGPVLTLKVNSISATPVVQSPIDDLGTPPDVQVFAISEGSFSDTTLDDICFWNRVLTNAERDSFIGGSVPASGKVLHLDMEDSGDIGKDVSGSANHFTNVTGPVLSVASTYGSLAAKGDSANGAYLNRAGASDDLNGFGLSFSIGFRIKPSAADLANGFLCLFAARGGSNGNGTWGIDCRSGTILCYCYNGSTYDEIHIDGALVQDVWNSVVFRFVMP